MEVFCPIAILAGIVALFVLQRFWTGKLRLFDKNTSGNGSFTPLQEIVEPNVQHVIQVKDQKRYGVENGPPPDEEASEKP